MQIQISKNRTKFTLAILISIAMFQVLCMSTMWFSTTTKQADALVDTATYVGDNSSPLFNANGTVNGTVLSALLAETSATTANANGPSGTGKTFDNDKKIKLFATVGSSSSNQEFYAFTSIDWQPVFLTQQSNGDKIVTLWMTKPYAKCDYSGNYTTNGRAFDCHSDYYNSRVRAVMNSCYQNIFTGSGAYSGFSQYIVAPSQIAWQTNNAYLGQNTEQGEKTTKTYESSVSISNIYNGLIGTYGSGPSVTRDGTAITYTDKLWLPSVYEIGTIGQANYIYNSASNNTGLWGMATADRSHSKSGYDVRYAYDSSGNTITASSKYDEISSTLLRSGYSSNSYSARHVEERGNVNYNYANITYGVRAALHLNLTQLVSDNSHTATVNSTIEPSGAGVVKKNGTIITSNATVSNVLIATVSSGTLTLGSTTFTAIANTDYAFISWQYLNSSTWTDFNSLDLSATTTFRAKFAHTYTISFNANGGSGGQNAEVIAAYDSAMPAISTTAPSRDGYTFGGWYDTSASTGGTKYYNADGTSAKSWDKNENTTLYARWNENTGGYFNKTMMMISTGIILAILVVLFVLLAKRKKNKKRVK